MDAAETSDKGLAGAFNFNLIKAAVKFAADHPDARVEYELVGRKGRDYYRKRQAPVTGEHGSAKVKYEDTSGIARKLMERFANDEIDAVYLIYNEFKSVMAQKLTISRVLPAEIRTGRCVHSTPALHRRQKW